MKEKIPILLLHGWGLSQKVFLPLARELGSLGYQIYSFDFPGFGEKKQLHAPYTLTDYVTHVHSFITAHGIHQPILIGHSFGGRVALKYTYMYPNSVRALILSGTPGFSPVSSIKRKIFYFISKIGGWVFALPILNALGDSIRKYYYYIAGARDFYRAEGIMRQTFKNVILDSLLPYMQSVNVPCLLLWGENDLLVPPLVAERMQKVIHGSSFIQIPNGDHCVSFREPQVFANITHTFIKNT